MSHKASQISTFHLVALVTTLVASAILAAVSVFVAIALGTPAALGWVILAAVAGWYTLDKLTAMKPSGSPRHARSSVTSS